MKKTIMALVCMLLLTGMAHAQLSNIAIRIDGAVNFSKGDYKVEKIKDITTKPVVGYRVGASVNVPFAGMLYFAPGISFRSMGGETTIAGIGKELISATTRTHHIDIPLHLGFRIPVGQTLAFNLQAGPYLSYAMAGTTTYKVGDLKKQFDIFKEGIKELGKEKRFDVGLGANAMVDINRIYVLLGADFGLLNQLESNAKDAEAVLKNTSFHLGVGFRL